MSNSFTDAFVFAKENTNKTSAGLIAGISIAILVLIAIVIIIIILFIRSRNRQESDHPTEFEADSFNVFAATISADIDDLDSANSNLVDIFENNNNQFEEDVHEP